MTKPPAGAFGLQADLYTYIPEPMTNTSRIAARIAKADPDHFYHDRFTVDQLGAFQLMPVDVLAAAARGELDLNAIARKELAGRGLNWQGAWVGFDRAASLATCHPVVDAKGKVRAVSVPGRDE